MSSRGWIKLHRRIQDHWIYQEKRVFSRYEAWLDLIMLANHKDNKTLIDGELITVGKGSLITSKRKLCMRWKWSNTKVNGFLDLLEQDEMINQKSDTKKTVVTIVQYEVYHELEKEKHYENISDVSGSEEEDLGSETKGTQKNITKTSGESLDVVGLEETKEREKHHESITETHQKHNRSITETHKQELKNLRTKELKKDLKDSTTTVENDAIVFYQNNIGMLRPIISEEILDWINDLGDVMVIESLKRSLERNKPSWGYAKSILKSWHEKGIRSIEQAKAEEVEFKNQQQSKFGKAKSNEVVPEWFRKRKDNEMKEAIENKHSELSPEEQDQEEAEIRALLARHSN